MGVKYNNNSLIPAPLVSISKNYAKDEGGNRLRAEYDINLNGNIVNVDSGLDSPGANGVTAISGVMAAQRYILDTFSCVSGLFQITDPDTSGVLLSCYARVENTNFSEGTWVNRGQYTVSLKANILNGDSENLSNLESATESYDVSENEDGSWNIQHQLNAVGYLYYTSSGVSDPLGTAKNWCRNRSHTISSSGNLNAVSDTFDFSNLITSGISGTNNFWNMSCNEGVGNTQYSWRLTENFIYNPSGNYKEEFSASINYDQDNIRKVVANVNGTIIGLAGRASDLATRNRNAKNKFNTTVEPNIYTRISEYIPSGYTLNPVWQTKQISYEENQASIKYSITYVAFSGCLISGAIDEIINVSDAGPTDIFAQISVPGRANGPVVQYMQTSTLPERTVSIQAVMCQDTTLLTLENLTNLYYSKPNTDAIINALKPCDGYYYVKQNSEEWNCFKRAYSRTVSWVIQPEGADISGVPVTSGFCNPA